jgi:hypothetical protein
MTREETVQVLSLLKAAYPNSYKGMTRQEGNGVISVWATQLSYVPVEVVLMAVNKLISTSTFPPSISEVKAKFKDIYWECVSELSVDKWSHELTDSQRAKLNSIADACQGARDQEPSVMSLMGGQPQRKELTE